MTKASPVGNSESEQQLALLREENRLLREELDEWVIRAGEREKTSKRLQKSELKVLAAETVAQTASVVVNDVGLGDKGIVTLVIHDPERELRRIVESEPPPQAIVGRSVIPMHDLSSLESLLSTPFSPYLETLNPVMLEKLFPGRSGQVKSTLIMPLVQRGVLIGSLNLGGIHADSYAVDMATDVIERLTAIIAVALQNTLNQYRLRQAGLIDPLTTLNNRRFFDQRLVEEFDRAQRTRRPLCCLMIDIDYFKQVNDAYGHQVGDKVLQRVSQAMVEQMRSTDVLARYGGEEFVVLLPETLAVTAMDVAERLRTEVAREVILLDGGGEITITVSIGLSIIDTRNSTQDTPRTLLAYADQALYKAKHGGRNRVER